MTRPSPPSAAFLPTESFGDFVQVAWSPELRLCLEGRPWAARELASAFCLWEPTGRWDSKREGGPRWFLRWDEQGMSGPRLRGICRDFGQRGEAVAALLFQGRLFTPDGLAILSRDDMAWGVDSASCAFGVELEPVADPLAWARAEASASACLRGRSAPDALDRPWLVDLDGPALSAALAERWELSREAGGPAEAATRPGPRL